MIIIETTSTKQSGIVPSSCTTPEAIAKYFGILIDHVTLIYRDTNPANPIYNINDNRRRTAYGF